MPPGFSWFGLFGESMSIGTVSLGILLAVFPVILFYRYLYPAVGGASLTKPKYALGNVRVSKLLVHPIKVWIICSPIFSRCQQQDNPSNCC